MILFPAIDLLGGRVVRLEHGERSAARVYSEHPAEIARRWESEGAEWLHVVDLDRAFGDGGDNRGPVGEIAAAVRIPIQLGGGLRSDEDVAEALALGVARVLLGTRAVQDPAWLAALVKKHGDRVAVAIDSRKGTVEIQGWVESSQLSALEFAAQLARIGVTRVVVTDIDRDGSLGGINLGLVGGIARATGLKVIASGGAATESELEKLRLLAGAGLEGVVVGRALYEGLFTLEQARALLGSG